jgi:glycosyltransferase involved in cell wall biosynthesis
MQPAIIIPVYNHASAIGLVVEQARNLGLPVYVVDDGSTDSTGAVIDKIAGITVLRHRVNLGKGAAILSGFAAAHVDRCNWALTLDGDGQHDPTDAVALLQAVKNEERCLVVGRRQGMDDDKNVPWTSRFGRKFSNFWVWAAGGPWIEDSQSGFRLYPLPEAIDLDTKARRYQFEVEILVKAHRQGMIIRESPIRAIYPKKGERVSHFRPWRDFLRNSATFSRLICTRIFSLFRL